MGIGRKLQALIDEKDTNPNAVAVATGVNSQTIYSIIKRDSTKADIGELCKIANFLGADLNYFYDDKEKAPAKPLELNDNELKLIVDYRSASPDDKKMILRTAANAAFAASEQPAAKYGISKAAAEDWLEREALAANLPEGSQEAAQK